MASNQIIPEQKSSTTSLARYLPAGTGPAYCGPGVRITFLVTGAESGGALFVFENLVAPGGGAPPHLHIREDESFYLQQGTLVLQVGGKVINASAGDFVYIPRGTVHSFKNTSQETARLLTVVTPPGLENFFSEALLPAADIGNMPEAPDAMMARARKAASRHGLEFSIPA